MSDELKPCPFCGSPAESDSLRLFRDLSTGNLEHAVAVYCTVCAADISICLKDVTDAQLGYVVEAWNRRP